MRKSFSMAIIRRHLSLKIKKIRIKNSQLKLDDQVLEQYSKHIPLIIIIQKHFRSFLEWKHTIKFKKSRENEQLVKRNIK